MVAETISRSPIASRAEASLPWTSPVTVGFGAGNHRRPEAEPGVGDWCGLVGENAGGTQEPGSLEQAVNDDASEGRRRQPNRDPNESGSNPWLRRHIEPGRTGRPTAAGPEKPDWDRGGHRCSPRAAGCRRVHRLRRPRLATPTRTSRKIEVPFTTGPVLVRRFELEGREEDAASFANLGNDPGDGQIRLDRKRARPARIAAHRGSQRFRHRPRSGSVRRLGATTKRAAAAQPGGATCFQRSGSSEVAVTKSATFSAQTRSGIGAVGAPFQAPRWRSIEASKAAGYRVSRCLVCWRHHRQYLASSKRSRVLALFLVVT